MASAYKMDAKWSLSSFMFMLLGLSFHSNTIVSYPRYSNIEMKDLTLHFGSNLGNFHTRAKSDIWHVLISKTSIQDQHSYLHSQHRCTSIVPTTNSDSKAITAVMPTNQLNALQKPITALSSSSFSSRSWVFSHWAIRMFLYKHKRSQIQGISVQHARME